MMREIDQVCYAFKVPVRHLEAKVWPKEAGPCCCWSRDWCWTSRNLVARTSPIASSQQLPTATWLADGASCSIYHYNFTTYHCCCCSFWAPRTLWFCGHILESRRGLGFAWAGWSPGRMDGCGALT